MRIVMILTFLMLFLVNIVSAEIYKWVDENGTIHFSDVPIADKSIERFVPKAGSDTAGYENKPVNYSQPPAQPATRAKTSSGKRPEVRELTEKEKQEKMKADFERARDAALNDPDWRRENARKLRLQKREFENRVRARTGY